MWGIIFLVFLIAVPALVVGALAFTRLPSDCTVPSMTVANATNASSVTSSHAACPHWGYSDTTKWGDLCKAYELCSAGKRQSPINIMAADAKLADSTETRISLADFQDGSMALPNAFAHKATMSHNGHAVGAAGVQGYFRHNAKWYKLLQFHFHTPSEHTIDGFSFPVEMHMVHQDATGAYLVIGVLFDNANDATHESMQEILQDFPVKEEEPSTLKTFNYTRALEYWVGEGTAPFYTYSGSFTTPPCTESVKWILLTKPKAMSNAHAVRLKNAMGENNRPVQPLYERSVSKQE